jgi:ABC-type bacteriocin/lantibiotic exporter with double-glycine peptidase domain
MMTPDGAPTGHTAGRRARRVHLPRALNRLRRRRVPVLRQLSAVECGPACLAMILSYHGRATTVAECRERCGGGRDGTTARTLTAVARGYGLRPIAYSLEPAACAELALPAIIHWEFNHFVVLESWTPHAVAVVDPAQGRRRLSAAAFDQGFTGVALTFTPDAGFIHRRAPRQVSWLRYVARPVRSAPGILAQILVASILLLIAGLVLPVATGIVVDHIVPGRMTDVLPVLGLGFALAVLTQLVTAYLRGTLLASLQARLDAHLMSGFVGHLFALPYRFFQQRATGDLLMRLASNATIREIVTGQTLSFILDGTLVLGYVALLLLRAPTFGALVIGLGALQFALFVLAQQRLYALTQQELVTQAAEQSYLADALGGMATLKASGGEERAFARWSNLFVADLNVTLQRNQLIALIDAAQTALRTASPLALLWVGVGLVLNGSLSTGTMLALSALASAALAPLVALVANVQQLQVAQAQIERIADVLEAAPEQDTRTAMPAPRLSGRIELRQVSFRYDAQAAPIVSDISLTVEPGQKIALVGRTGSGKTTLALLLLGLYEPTEGDILYDGHSLRTLDYRSLRRQFGVVLQEARLFAGSIRQNIAADDPTVSLDQVMAAARVAAIDEEIAALPMGYETLVTEGGGGLSGGQRQRIALARAVVRQPSVLLLDEATSHLDALTEARVDANVSALACTRVVIAHRLSTIRDADLILMVEAGRIVERGTNAQLVARGGQYAVLVRGQVEGGTDRHES